MMVSRQIFEAVLIFRAGDNVLNSKAEYNRSKVPRLSVMINEGQQESFKKTNQINNVHTFPVEFNNVHFHD